MNTVTTAAALRTEYLRSVLLFMAAFATFAVVDTSAKWLAQSYPIPMIVWLRYAIQTLLLLLVLGPMLGMRLVRTNRPRLQILRGLLLVVSSFSLFTAITLMPIAEASAIAFMSPLILTGLAAFVLRERVSLGTWIAVALGFAGVLLIKQPGTGFMTPAIGFALTTAVLFSVFQLMTRKLAGVDLGYTTLFYSTAVGAVVLSFFVPLYWVMPKSIEHAFLFVAMGGLGTLAHLSLILAYEHTPASALQPFVYVQLFVATLLGYGVFGEMPTPSAWLGMTLIVAAGIWVVTRPRA